MNWFNLLAEPGKTQASELALQIGFPCLFAIAIFGFGYSREKDGGPGWIKYLSIPILIGAAFYGWSYFTYAHDPIAVNGDLIGGNSKIAYNAAFLIPAALIPLMVIFNVAAKKFIDNESRL